MSLFYTILSTLVISFASFAGVLTLGIHREKLARWTLTLVALSAGTMLGAAMFHLLPEAAEALDPTQLFGLVTISFVAFFLIEKVLHWRHCHDDHCEEHSIGMMNLIGDSIHNLIDGLIIGASFAVSPQIGVVTTLAIMLHEIPQEIGDFGVLLHAGWPVKKALLANFFVAVTSVLGGIIGFFLAESSTQFAFILMPIAAGGFIYIAASDLIPEIRKEKSGKGSLRTTIFFLLGLSLMYGLTLLGLE